MARAVSDRLQRGSSPSPLGGGARVHPPRVGDHVSTRCPVCAAGTVDATYRSLNDGTSDWLIVCMTGDCRRMGGYYLPALAEAVGQPRWASKVAIVRELRQRARPRRRGRVSPPTEAQVNAWEEALPDSPAYPFLTARRGVSAEVLRRARVGWDENTARATFPLFSEGEIVGMTRRTPKPGAQMIAPPGSADWPLYLEPDPKWKRVLVVAGMLDVLAGLSAGLPAVSPPFGVRQWRDEWTEQLRPYREVIVCFDNGEQAAAKERVEALTAAGLNARHVNLRKLRFNMPKGDLTDYLKCGGNPQRLMRPKIKTKVAA